MILMMMMMGKESNKETIQINFIDPQQLTINKVDQEINVSILELQLVEWTAPVLTPKIKKKKK